ncbi:MAG: protein kinase domain-containing protein [Ktedonobacteraceae bacterium]
MIPSSFFCDTCGAENVPQASFCRTCGHSLQSTGNAARNNATGRLLTNHLLKQRYRILDVVGKGGMGAAYSAEDTQLGNRKVAIKEMSQSGLSPQAIIDAAEAFKQEAHILARLQHPNLPNIYDHFTETGRWYLVMSFIPGETLGDYLNKANGGKLPVGEALQIGIQLCTVLNYLHSQQPPIIFRDLKPFNIMRTFEGHLYLIDFGIARHFKPGQARDTAAYGSMGYAAPEQYGKAQTTPRSDIYSLGALLHQMLSGLDPSITPFLFPPLQAQVPAIPAELATLVEQMLEMDEDKRPTSLLEVKQKLQSIIASAPMPVFLASVAPTQYVRPDPGAPTQVVTSPGDLTQVATSPGAPTQVVTSPPQSVVPPSPRTPVKVWRFGRRQLIASVIGILLCGIVYYFSIYQAPVTPLVVAALNSSNTWYFLFLNTIFSGFVFVVPILLGSIYGPWAGLLSAIGGTCAGILLYDRFHFWEMLVPDWELNVVLALAGFIVGFVLLRTQGRYNKWSNVAFVVLVSCLLISITEAFIYGLVYHDGFVVAIFESFVEIIPLLILLPLLLITSNMFIKRVKQSHP